MASQPTGGGGRYVDVAALLDGGLNEPHPVVLTRSDGHSIFYAGHVNVLFGDPECGKTWIALSAIEEAAKARRRCAFVDIDHNGAAALLGRLLAIGVPDSYLRDPDVFRLYEPDDSAEVTECVTELVGWRPAIAVVDSIGELIPMFGANSNSPDDYTAVNRAVLTPLASAGACVIAIDHLSKNADRLAGATGTAAKRRTATGSSVRVTLKDTFTPGRGGSCSLTIHKDRNGQLRAHCPPKASGCDQMAGVFTLTPGPAGGMRWNLSAPPQARLTEDDVAALLDQLGVPLPAGEIPAGEALEKAGNHVPRTLLRDALRARRNRPVEVRR